MVLSLIEPTVSCSPQSGQVLGHPDLLGSVPVSPGRPRRWCLLWSPSRYVGVVVWSLDTQGYWVLRFLTVSRRLGPARRFRPPCNQIIGPCARNVKLYFRPPGESAHGSHRAAAGGKCSTREQFGEGKNSDWVPYTKGVPTTPTLGSPV